MATVTVQQKGNYWYTVINYKDEHGKWKNKMQATGLSLKGNKKKAEKIAMERLASFIEPDQLDDNNPLLVDYLRSWLTFIENRVEISTYNGYVSSVECVLIPYFEPKKMKLKDLTLKDAQKFYDEILNSNRGRGGKPPQPTTIRRYHAAFHSALEHAIKMEMIENNPTDRVDLPRRHQVKHNTFSEEQLMRLNNLIVNEDIGPLIWVDSIYGLRRSEICGLKWKAVDFENDVFTIEHTVIVAKGKDGKKHLIKKDRTKNASSCRTFPLDPDMKILLLELRRQQEENRKLFGKAYNEADSEYVFVDRLGNLINPDYLSRKYSRLRDKYELPHVTLHEIRHTVATLGLRHTSDMKAVQDYLGHSDYSTTANIYAHVDSSESKVRMAELMSNVLKGKYKKNEE